jgi:hypothetical protein
MKILLPITLIAIGGLITQTHISSTIKTNLENYGNALSQPQKRRFLTL